MFMCNKCSKVFKTNQHYTTHMNRKTPCVKEIIRCDNCLQEFKTRQILNKHLARKFKCEKVDLRKEIDDLKHQLEISRLKEKMTHITNNITNNIVLNNFGDEAISKIKYSALNCGLEKIMNNKLLLTDANYKVGDFEYTNKDIKDIDIFRLFVKLIFNNKDLPQNKTLLFDDQDDKFYYYMDNEWLPFEQKSNDLLIDIIFKKIQDIILDKRFHLENNMKELTSYVGDEYSLYVNTIDNTDPVLMINDSDKKARYNKILVLEYKKKLSVHQFNIK